MNMNRDDTLAAVAELVVDKDAFRLRNDGDDLRVDQLCRELLLRYYEDLLRSGMQPAEATGWAGGADYYLRDFVLDRKRLSVFDERPGLVSQFAGNWYIVNTVEPNAAELSRHLTGIKGFYRFLSAHALITADYLTLMESECDDLAYYERRIESFWGITGDGYAAWEKECTLKD